MRKEQQNSDKSTPNFSSSFYEYFRKLIKFVYISFNSVHCKVYTIFIDNRFCTFNQISVNVFRSFAESLIQSSVFAAIILSLQGLTRGVALLWPMYLIQLHPQSHSPIFTNIMEILIPDVEVIII